MGRACHTVTCLGHSLLVVGGSSGSQVDPGVAMLDRPALTHGLLQQRELSDSRRMLAAARGACADLEAEGKAARLALAAAEARLQVGCPQMNGGRVLRALTSNQG